MNPVGIWLRPGRAVMAWWRAVPGRQALLNTADQPATIFSAVWKPNYHYVGVKHGDFAIKTIVF
jgi:hypothetical protein